MYTLAMRTRRSILHALVALAALAPVVRAKSQDLSREFASGPLSRNPQCCPDWANRHALLAQVIEEDPNYLADIWPGARWPSGSDATGFQCEVGEALVEALPSGDPRLRAIREKLAVLTQQSASLTA